MTPALATACTAARQGEGRQAVRDERPPGSVTATTSPKAAGAPSTEPTASTPAVPPAHPIRTVMVHTPATVVTAQPWSPNVWNRIEDDSADVYLPDAIATSGSGIVVLDPADGAIDWFDRAGRLTRHVVVQPTPHELLFSMAVRPGTSTVYALSSPGCCYRPMLHVVTGDGRLSSYVVPAVSVAHTASVPISATADGTVWLHAFNDDGAEASYPVFAHGRPTSARQARAGQLEGVVMADGSRVSVGVDDSTVDVTVTDGSAADDYQIRIPGRLSSVSAIPQDHDVLGRVLLLVGGVSPSDEGKAFALVLQPSESVATLVPIQIAGSADQVHPLALLPTSFLVVGGDDDGGWIHRYALG